MKRLLPVIGVLCLLIAGGVHATTFDTYFDGAEQQMSWSLPSEKIVDFVIREMQFWHEDGIMIFPSDIEAAVRSDTDTLCAGKVNMAGIPISFARGSLGDRDGCQQLKGDILSLVNAEVEAEQLGADLLAIANGSELAIADQPHRPGQVGTPVLLASRLWSGTGTRILPWPGGPDTPAEDLFLKLDAALSRDPDLDETVWRFQHGYFRDLRESDPELIIFGTEVQGILDELAKVMGIAGDLTKRGEFATPDLQTENVGFWARADDLGLMWIVPDHVSRIGDIKPAGIYPQYKAGGDGLAYPFFYHGSFQPPEAIGSPLCSRSAGMLGYLCRPKPSPTGLCAKTTGTGIELITCNPQYHESPLPDICMDIHKLLFENTGLPLPDPNDPRFVNPNLVAANTGSLCTPDYKVLYKDEVPAHACYIAYCLRQSMSGHTLITNRSPNVVSEATSPFLGCIRPDPQLGLYAELARTPSISLPTYMGLGIVHDLERGYCAKSGQLPHPVASYCTYLSNRRVNSIQQTYANTTASTAQEFAATASDLKNFHALATIIGQRTILDQSYPIYRKLIESLAQSIQETSNLLNDLELAPLTKAVCPWTGAFTKPAP